MSFHRFSITSKLFLLLFVFVLIFYGTLVHIFFHIQKMMNLSEEIVSINNVVADQSKILIENLLEMDANVKKFTLLQNDIYREYFDTAQKLFDSSLINIDHLTARGYTAPAVFSLFLDEYNSHLDTVGKTEWENPENIMWVDETKLNTWLALLVQFRDLNQNDIEESLMHIHDMTLNSMRNGLIGFGFSIIASFFGVWFISRSIITPSNSSLMDFALCLWAITAVKSQLLQRMNFVTLLPPIMR